MRVITVNVNGIRAAIKKGLLEYLSQSHADHICIQETKAQVSALPPELLMMDGYQLYHHDAIKKGYSGTAIYTRHQPKAIHRGLGFKCADDEGRYIQLDFEQYAIASIYLPSGTTGDVRQRIKMDFCDRYLEFIKRIDQPIIVGGDFNIAHQKKDIKNWRGNLKSSGFLPEERAWLDTLFDEHLLIDAFRLIHDEPHQYTWWSYRSKAWDNNAGWRIDYQMISPHFSSCVLDASIFKDRRFSDHAPLVIDYDLSCFRP